MGMGLRFFRAGARQRRLKEAIADPLQRGRVLVAEPLLRHRLSAEREGTREGVDRCQILVLTPVYSHDAPFPWPDFHAGVAAAQEVVREGDLTGRIGEQVIVILQDVDADKAMAVARRVQHQISAASTGLGTLTWMVAVFSGLGASETVDEMLQRAHAAALPPLETSPDRWC